MSRIVASPSLQAEARERNRVSAKLDQLGALLTEAETVAGGLMDPIADDALALRALIGVRKYARAALEQFPVQPSEPVKRGPKRPAWHASAHALKDCVADALQRAGQAGPIRFTSAKSRQLHVLQHAFAALDGCTRARSGIVMALR